MWERDRTSENNKITLKKKFEKYHVPDSSHDVGAGANVDDVRVPLEVVCRVVDAKRLVNRYLATLVNISI